MTLQPWRAWQARVNRHSLRCDASAALTGAIIVLPQAMAYAMIAGLPPQYGLYCAMVPAIFAALFGSSWHLVSGPTAAISIVIFATLSPLAVPGSATYISLGLTLAFMVGCIQILIALCGLGKLTDKIPHSVIVGFTTGAAVLIATSQIKHFLGLSLQADIGFVSTLNKALANIQNTNWQVLTVGLITVASTLASKYFLKSLPHMVIGILGGTLTAVVFHNPEIRSVGSLPSALPPLSMPSWNYSVWQSLSQSAVVVALLALTEAIAIGKAVALRSGQTINGNQETMGQGLSNIAAAFFSGYPVSGSFTRSGVNYEAGALTPVAAILSAVILMGILMLIAPLVSYLPIAAMAATLLLVAWGLLDFKQIRKCFSNKIDASILMTTVLACLFLSIEIAVFSGIALSVGLAIFNRKSKV
jgi:sulfate permease, SulP family